MMHRDFLQRTPAYAAARLIERQRRRLAALVTVLMLVVPAAAHSAASGPAPHILSGDWVRPDQYRPEVDRSVEGIDPSDYERMLADTPWKSLTQEAAPAPENKKEDIHIRLAMMPGADVQAAPDVRISKPRLAEAVPAPLPKKIETKVAEKPKEQAPAQACETVSEARKKRIEAIEGDRRTLLALRRALHDMKLTKKLSSLAEQIGAREEDDLSPPPDKTRNP